jgi:2-oxo-4-hydroxy-4-carboxy-5-ureidoimidazoline decarboxylase
MTAQTPLANLNACSRADFVAALANIFEYSPWIAEKAADARPFAGASPAGLIWLPAIHVAYL